MIRHGEVLSSSTVISGNYLNKYCEVIEPNLEMLKDLEK